MAHNDARSGRGGTPRDQRARGGVQCRSRDLSIQPALTGAQAVEKARQSRPALIVLDIMLPISTGLKCPTPAERGEGRRGFRSSC